jgi:alpha-ketoglutarate-dependent taurine dioxygenase
MSIAVEPLNDAIGSEVYGGAEALLSPGVAAKLRRLLVERGVLVFRGLNITDEQQVTLARGMGSLRPEGENGIFKVTLDTKVGGKGAEYLKGSFHWHLDGTHDDVPVFASLLSGKTLSDAGGQTEFANSCAAYEALSDDMKARIAELEVVHSVEVSMRNSGVEATPENVQIWQMSPPKTHKLVWTHQDGRKSLVIGIHASHVVGMDRAASDALLAELLAHVTQERFVYRHEWTLGDLVIWDNTGVLHRAEPYPIDSGRLMHRTTLLGEEAFA